MNDLSNIPEITDEESLSIESFIQIGEIIFSEATEKTLAILDNESVKDSFKMFNEVGENLSKSLGAIRALKTVASIPTKLFMIKAEKVCKGVAEIPIDKRQKFLKKIGKKKFNKEAVFVLTVIDKVEELSKIDIFLKILEKRMDEQITEEEYHRYFVRVDHTLLSDIMYMKDNLETTDFPLDCVQLEGLFSNGWIVYSGQNWTGLNEDESETVKIDDNRYNYSKSAREFCKIVFGLIPKE